MSSLGLALVTSLPAHATTWPAPVDLSTVGANGTSPQVVVGPDGTATAVWTRASTVQVASRPAGGSWSSSQDLSAAGAGSSPAIAVAPDGAVTVVWNNDDPATVSHLYNIQAATRQAGGGWGPSTDISLGTGTNDPQIGIGADGTAAVVWQQAATPSGYLVRGNVRTGSGAWQGPQTLSAASSYAGGAHVAVAPDGTATAVWGWRNSTNYEVQSASHASNGIWVSQQTLSDSAHDADSEQVAVGADGTATAVWRFNNGTQEVVQTASRPTSGTWSAATTLSDAAQESESPEITIGADNAATAVWRHYNGSNYIIQAAARPTGGTWSPAADVSAAGQNAGQPQVAAAPNGTTVATWSRSNSSGNTIVQFSSRAAGGAWQTPDDLSAIAQNAEAPQVAVGADGTAAVVWDRSNGTNTIVQATAVDKAFAKPAPPKPPVTTPPAPVVPNTSAIKGPAKVARPKAATFTFTATAAGATFQCRLDKAKTWVACRSPYKLKTKKLKVGKHTLSVRAVLAGVADPSPSVKKFKVH